MHSAPTRTLREHPDLEQLKRQAKELLAKFKAGDPAATTEVHAHFHGADATTFALHDAQLVLARAYGFDSWPKLKAFVDGANMTRLAEAVRANDLDHVAALLKMRPELVHLDMAGNNEHRAIHYAVLNRLPDMARLLMRHGSDARKGIYPHRGATAALVMAKERGYDEIAAIIEEEESTRGTPVMPAAEALFRALGGDDSERVVALLEADPALADARNRSGMTVLDVAALGGHATVVDWLERHGAEQTARSAVVRGDGEWLRARHTEGRLVNPINDWGGLLTIAVMADRIDMLELLLDLGFDPDERTRLNDLDEAVMTWGMPLWRCVVEGRHAMAELLLARGADVNAQIYASGTPMFQAHSVRDSAMVELLARHGATVDAATLGYHRKTEEARRMLNETAPEAIEALAEELVWAGGCGGDPEIVRMAMAKLTWERDDPRWYRMLEQPLRMWNHMDAFWANPAFDRGTYLECLWALLERCDPNVRGRFGLTILHDISGARSHVTLEDQVAFATALLDAGARLDVRDDLLRSTPLGWACRWGRAALVRLLLERGADPREPDAEPWASPLAWATKMGHQDVIAEVTGKE